MYVPNSNKVRDTNKSNVTVINIFGLCTFTATSSPFFSFALYTWPKDAAAIGSSNAFKDWKIVAGSTFNSFRIIFNATSELNGGTCS